MSTISRTFSAASQATDELSVARGRSASYTLTGTFDATIELQRRYGDGPWETILSTTTTVAETVIQPKDRDARYRMVCTARASGSPVATLADKAREIEAFVAQDGSRPVIIREDGIEATVFLALFAGLLRLTAIESGLTAHAGGGKASALALDATKTVHHVGTVGTAADSILLPPAVVGEVHVVVNAAAANSMQVFGAGTDTINDVATATGVAQAAGKTGLYVCVIAGKWFRILSA